jgi:hypothetical protein
MTHQIRRFVWQLSANVNLYRLVALGLALAAMVAPLGMPGGGGGGGVG